MEATAENTVASTACECVQGVRRVTYIAMAALFFAFGAIGVVLPGLPTTPFWLLTSYFLARSWPALNRRLMKNRLIGPMLHEWHQHRSVKRSVKRTAIVMVVCAVVFVVALGNLTPVGLATMLSAATIGLAVVCRLPVRDEP